MPSYSSPGCSCCGGGGHGYLGGKWLQNSINGVCEGTVEAYVCDIRDYDPESCCDGNAPELGCNTYIVNGEEKCEDDPDFWDWRNTPEADPEIPFGDESCWVYSGWYSEYHDGCTFWRKRFGALLGGGVLEYNSSGLSNKFNRLRGCDIGEMMDMLPALQDRLIAEYGWKLWGDKIYDSIGDAATACANCFDGTNGRDYYYRSAIGQATSVAGAWARLTLHRISCSGKYLCGSKCDPASPPEWYNPCYWQCYPDRCDLESDCCVHDPSRCDVCDSGCFDTYCDWCDALIDPEHDCYDEDAWWENWCWDSCP